jgi:flagellar hook-associated protein 2
MSQLKSRGLQNDNGLLLNLEQDLRSVLNSPADTGGQYNYASEVGVTTQADGTVAVDATKLSAALTNDFSSVAKLFSDPTNGLAVRLSNLASGFIGANGAVQGRTDSINSQLKSLASDRTSMTARLDQVQSTYLAQFNSLDTLLASMQTTSTYLTQQLQSLNSLNLSIANNPSKTS